MGVLDEYFPFDLGYGSPANTARWRKMAQLWQTDGVFAGYLNQLNATLASGTVTVQTGGLFLHGYYGEVQTPQSITVLTNGTVVAGIDLTNQDISIYYRDGVVDYGTGGYEQDASFWEMPLWLVSGGTSLIDLRTMISPGAGSGWWATQAGPVSISSSATVNTNVLTLRVPYAGTMMIRGEVLLTFMDTSIAQTAICQLVYQYGQSDVQSSPTITPGIPGGALAGGHVSWPVSLSGQIPVTQGKKTLGWKVSAGTGAAAIQLSTLNVSATILNLPAVA